MPDDMSQSPLADHEAPVALFHWRACVYGAHMKRMLDRFDAVRTRRRAARRFSRLRRLALFVQPGPVPARFVRFPRPIDVPDLARGQKLREGCYPFAGQDLPIPELDLWAIELPETAAHGPHRFDWLEDLAASGPPGYGLMRRWLGDWIARFGDGKGPGWDPASTGARLAFWLAHAPQFLRGAPEAWEEPFRAAAARHGAFLERGWRLAPPGRDRLDALIGLLFAGIALEDREPWVMEAQAGIAALAPELIAEDGGVADRAPQTLAACFTLLVWAEMALRDHGLEPDPPHRAAIERAGRAVRALRLGDGGLARFHGGHGGRPGRLNQALAEARISVQNQDDAMGFARLHAGRTRLIMDCAPPPTGPGSENAHASTLAFEMSSGLRPLIVGSGAGRLFGARWSQAARESACHSMLVVEERSIAEIEDRPALVRAFGPILRPAFGQTSPPPGIVHRSGGGICARHGGYAARFGLTSERELTLSPDGAKLSGEERLYAADATAHRRYDRAVQELGRPLRFALHFHLHPDVRLRREGTRMLLELPRGEIWGLRAHGGDMQIGDGVYLDLPHLPPRTTKQLVLRGTVAHGVAVVSWALTRMMLPRAASDVPRTDQTPHPNAKEEALP